jgi:hypothetical protein
MGPGPERFNDTLQQAFGRLLHHEYTRQFWLLQVGGWLGLSIIGFFSLNLWYNQPGLYYLGHTLLQSVLGLVVSWPLRSIYRRVWYLPPRPRLVVIAIAVLAFAFIWAALRLVLFSYMTGEAEL